MLTLLVFEYKFTMPNTKEEMHVIWDYQNGLTRITPFFKALKYSKVHGPAYYLCLRAAS